MEMKTTHSASDGGLDLGRLLRLQAMLMHVGQAPTTFHAGGALIDAHNNLRAEMLRSLESEPLSGLRSEYERLFPALPELRHPRPVTPDRIHAFQEETSEAHLSLR